MEAGVPAMWGRFVTSRCSEDIESMESCAVNAASAFRSCDNATLEKPSLAPVELTEAACDCVCATHPQPVAIRRSVKIRSIDSQSIQRWPVNELLRHSDMIVSMLRICCALMLTALP